MMKVSMHHSQYHDLTQILSEQQKMVLRISVKVVAYTWMNKMCYLATEYVVIGGT